MPGQFKLNAIPLHAPLVMATLACALVLCAALLGALARNRKPRARWTDWVTSVDDRRVGAMYIILALVMLLRGVVDALLLRAQQGGAVNGTDRYLPPLFYDQVFTARGALMMFFIATPFIVGLLNVMAPPQTGARDGPLPFANALGFWLCAIGAVLVMLSLFVGEFAVSALPGAA